MKSRFKRSLGLAVVLCSVGSLVFTAGPAGAAYEPGTGWGSPGTGSGQFDFAASIAVHGDHVYVVERLNHRVQKFTTSGAFVSQWGTNGSGNGQFHQPEGIDVGPDGSVYVTDLGNKRVQKFDANGSFLGSFGSEGQGDGQFASPKGIVVDDDGYIYVSDMGLDRVQKFTPQFAFVWARGSEGVSPHHLWVPTHLALDSAGNVYVADRQNHRIQKLSPSGEFIGRWGNIKETPYTEGIDIDGDGNVLLTDSSNRVQKRTPDGDFLTSWELLAPVDTPTSGRDVAVDEAGHVYVVELRDAVQKFLAIRPTTTLSGPAFTSDRTPTFQIGSDTAGATFECRLQYPGTSFEPCAAPFTTAKLLEGKHILLVRAKAPDGLLDLTPAKKKFVIDLTRPQTVLDGGPAGATKDRTPTFKFWSTEKGTFQCKLDAKPFKACKSPYTTPRLSFGRHTFSVRAIDRAGNVDKTPATIPFEVQR